MKVLKLLSLGLFATSMMACAQNSESPKAVTEAFAKKFPTATSVKWDKESETEWEAEFKMNKVEFSANFLQDGTWKETEHEIEEKDVPQNVKDALMSAFSGYDIEEVEVSETAKGLVYEFGIEKGHTEMEVAINQNGTIVRKETKKAADEDDDKNDND